MSSFLGSLIKRKGFVIIWLLFFIYLLVQHWQVWMYIDDFGYASLSYAVNAGTRGNEYSILDIIRYCYMHYMTWGGRVLYYGIAILCYHFIGLKGIRIVQSVIIFLIFVYIYRMIPDENKKEHPVAVSVILCSMYGCFQVSHVCEGLYWFSASSGYVWPILVILAAAYKLSRMKREDSWRTWGLHGLLWFMASFSSEQCAVAAVVFCAGLLIYHWICNGWSNKYLSVLLWCISGAVIMLAAPGNYARLNTLESMDIGERIRYNVPFLLEYTFVPGSRIFFILVLVCILIAVYGILKSQAGNTFVRCLLGMYECLLLVSVSVLVVYQRSVSEYSGMRIRIIAMVVVIMGLALMGWYLLLRGMVYQFVCLVAAVACYGAMAVSPTLPGRVILPLMWLLLPVMGTILMDLLKDLRGCMAYVPILILLAGNVIEIYNGYHENSPVHAHNFAVLKETSEKVKQGEEIESVVLNKLPNEVYTAPMTYMSGGGWLETTMYIYFDIPDTVTIIWE